MDPENGRWVCKKTELTTVNNSKINTKAIPCKWLICLLTIIFLFIMKHKITHAYWKIVWNTYRLSSTHFNIFSHLLQFLFSWSFFFLIWEESAGFPLSLTDCKMQRTCGIFILPPDLKKLSVVVMVFICLIFLLLFGFIFNFFKIRFVWFKIQNVQRIKRWNISFLVPYPSYSLGTI